MLQTNDGETYWKPFEHTQNINLNKALKNSIAKTMNLYRLCRISPLNYMKMQIKNVCVAPCDMDTHQIQISED